MTGEEAVSNVYVPGLAQPTGIDYQRTPRDIPMMNETGAWGNDTGARGTLRLEPGPHPTKRKREFLANYADRIRGFADRLADKRGTGGRFYILGWTRAAKMLKETPGATT